MKAMAAASALLLATACASSQAEAAANEPVMSAEIGKPAPAFTGTDIEGKKHTLKELAGKVVVLEWNNPECPFVKKHYGSGNMQALQKEITAKGVTWVSINSGAAGKQGNMDAAKAKTVLAENGGAPSFYLLDA